MSEENVSENNDMIGAYGNQSVERIMSLLKGEFKNLENFIGQRIKIKKEYDGKISEQYKQIFDTEKNDVDDSANKTEVDNINTLKNGLLQFEEPQEYEKDLDVIRHNVIVKYLQEKIVVDLFIRCVEKAEKEVNGNYINLFLEKCGFLQEINFEEFEEISDDYKKLPTRVVISKEEIILIADFVDECWKLVMQNRQNKTVDKNEEEYMMSYFQKELKIFLHHMFFEKMCGRKLTDIAIKTEITRKDQLKEFFKLENENNDENQNNNIFLDNVSNDDEIETNISGNNGIENYKNYVYEMPKDADVVNELYELERDDFLRKKRSEERAEEEYKKYEPIRELQKKRWAELAKLGKNINLKQFNAVLCALISNPRFIQTISENTSRQLNKNIQSMTKDDMDVFMEILNFVDLPLKNDGNSKGILDIAGWFNPQMYNNLQYLHDRLSEYKTLNFQMYCARHLDKIIDYEIRFNKRAEYRQNIALVLLVVAIVLYLSVQFGLITSISLPFAIGVSVPVGVIGLGLLAYNYFKSKIIKKAMILFGCSQWYQFGKDATNEKLLEKCTFKGQRMRRLVDSIFSLRRVMNFREQTTIKKLDLNTNSKSVKMAPNQNLRNLYTEYDHEYMAFG